MVHTAEYMFWLVEGRGNANAHSEITTLVPGKNGSTGMV